MSSSVFAEWIATAQKYDNVDPIKPYWDAYFGQYDDFTIYFWFTSIITTVAFFGTAYLFFLVDCIPYFQKYKIQPKKQVSWADYWKCLKMVLFNHLVLHSLTLYSNVGLFRYLGVSVETHDLPKPSRMLLEIFLHLICEDFCFYWCHRLLHSKKIYKYIHKLHHEYQAPFGLTAVYTHPVEELLTLGATMSGPFLFSRHILTIWIWLSIRLIETVDGHSGYEFPISIGNFIPLWSGSLHHDYHHEKFDYCFGSMFSFWDWICGTDSKFRRQQFIKASKGEHYWSDILERIMPFQEVKTPEVKEAKKA